MRIEKTSAYRRQHSISCVCVCVTSNMQCVVSCICKVYKKACKQSEPQSDIVDKNKNKKDNNEEKREKEKEREIESREIRLTN